MPGGSRCYTTADSSPRSRRCRPPSASGGHGEGRAAPARLPHGETSTPRGVRRRAHQKAERRPGDRRPVNRDLRFSNSAKPDSPATRVRPALPRERTRRDVPSESRSLPAPTVPLRLSCPNEAPAATGIDPIVSPTPPTPASTVADASLSPARQAGAARVRELRGRHSPSGGSLAQSLFGQAKPRPPQPWSFPPDSEESSWRP